MSFIRIADKDGSFQVLVESSPPITAFVIRPTATVKRSDLPQSPSRVGSVGGRFVWTGRR
jgi:hypothetical protein